MFLWQDKVELFYIGKYNLQAMIQPFQFSNGQLAYDADDLLALCQQFPDDGTNYLVREDLEKWLSYIGKNEIAQCATSARQTALEDRQKLEEFLTKCHSLSSPETTDVELAGEKNLVTENKLENSPIPMTEEKPDNNLDEREPLAKIQPEPNVVSRVIPEAKKADKSANSQSEKPSFFKLIASLIINVLYRNQK